MVMMVLMLMVLLMVMMVSKQGWREREPSLSRRREGVQSVMTAVFIGGTASIQTASLSTSLFTSSSTSTTQSATDQLLHSWEVLPSASNMRPGQHWVSNLGLAKRLYLPMCINPHRRIFRIYADIRRIGRICVHIRNRIPSPSLTRANSIVN